MGTAEHENTHGLIREHLPKGVAITSAQPYLDAIAEELNDREHQTLGFLTPREVFERQFTSPLRNCVNSAF